MAEKTAPVDKVVAKQNEAPSELAGNKVQLNDVLARRLAAVQKSKNNTPKMQRALDRLAKNLNAAKGKQ